MAIVHIIIMILLTFLQVSRFFEYAGPIQHCTVWVTEIVFSHGSGNCHFEYFLKYVGSTPVSGMSRAWGGDVSGRSNQIFSKNDELFAYTVLFLFSAKTLFFLLTIVT